MFPKMEKEKLFTINYTAILIFANLCQCCLKWKNLGAIRQHWQKLGSPHNLFSKNFTIVKQKNSKTKE